MSFVKFCDTSLENISTHLLFRRPHLNLVGSGIQLKWHKPAGESGL